MIPEPGTTPEGTNTPPDEGQATPPDRPQVPQVDRPETMEDVRALAEALAEYRKEVAALREDLAKQRGPRTTAAPTETPEERRKRRLELIAESSHYCPGCGRLSKYPRECTGGPNGAHPPIEMVATDELGGDPANHTAAPDTEVVAA